MRAQQRYLPGTRTSQSKHTVGEEFIVKGTENFYKGAYIETFDGKYYAGSSIENSKQELEKVANRGKEDNLVQGVTTVAIPLLLKLLQKFFKKKPTDQDRINGVTKRYFIQDKNNNKIIETDRGNYLLAKSQLPNRRFAETDWIIKGPAENSNINGYPFEGAVSKNKKAIQVLEKQLPGISTYITDYSFLVQEPLNLQKGIQDTQTILSQDPIRKLDNDRKANFDLKR
jgi:hypothetical protein